MFRIKDRTFVVASALLFAEIRSLGEARRMWGPRNEGIAWFLEVKTAENLQGDNDGWEPAAECLCKFPRIPWQEIAGQTLQWEDSWDEEMGSQRSGLYLLNYCPIRNSRLEFSERRMSEFRFRWNGLCDVGWDEDYGSNLDLLIEGNAQFIGIAVYERDSATAQRMLAQFQDPAEFTQTAIATYADGLTTTFQPKLAATEPMR